MKHSTTLTLLLVCSLLNAENLARPLPHQGLTLGVTSSPTQQPGSPLDALVKLVVTSGKSVKLPQYVATLFELEKNTEGYYPGHEMTLTEPFRAVDVQERTVSGEKRVEIVFFHQTSSEDALAYLTSLKGELRKVAVLRFHNSPHLGDNAAYLGTFEQEKSFWIGYEREKSQKQ